MPVRQRLRIFISSPGDVKVAREIAALTIERLAQDYARFFDIEPYLWEYEVMLASGHFQDSIEPPSAFEVVILILWSRLGTLLPEQTSVREYRGMDGRAPLTGTEWEFEEAFNAAKTTGVPDLLVYRSLQPAPFDMGDPGRFELQVQQFKALDGFWGRHFVNQGMFTGAYTTFSSDSEFSAALENHLRKLIQRRIDREARAPGEHPTKVWAQAPFRGLEAYEFVHAPIFFGQDEALAKAMLQLIAGADAHSPFLLVLGASGSGKSSLVKAGILPKLFVPRRIPGVAFVRRVVFRPSDITDGEDIFDALARRLTTQVSEDEGVSELLVHGQSAVSLAAHLRNAASEPAYPIGAALGQLTLKARQTGRMLEHESARLALVIDQLEELFANERISSADRRKFVALLAGLARSGLVWVIATMRRDFWHQAEEAPELLELSEELGRLELVPPTLSQFSQMIRRPAEAAGVGFEVHATTSVPLNEVIAEEVAREPGALPLLSYLLDQLYRADVLEAGGSVCTYATYEKLGKLEGAIATQAEAVLQRCAPEDRQALGSVLFALVQSTTEGDVERVTARRVPLASFPPGTPQRRLVEALLDPDARLLVSDADKEKIPTVRVAHEALISRWAQARDFLQSNAEALKIRRRIEERYLLWNALDGASDAKTARSAADPQGFATWRARFGRESGLLVDIDLVDGRRLLETHRSDTEPHLVAYIEHSNSDEKRIRNRSFRMLTAVTAIVGLLAIVALAAGRIASQKQREAEYQSAQTLKAQSRALTEAAAGRLKEGDISYAQALILEVLRNSGSSDSPDAAAVTVFQEARARDPLSAVLSGHIGALRRAAFSPDGTHIVTTGKDRTARIWDAHTGIELAVLSAGGKRWVTCADYSPDGTRIVTASDKIRIWDARTHALLSALGDDEEGYSTAYYSPDGKAIVTASDDVRIWDATTGQQLRTIRPNGVHLHSAAYSPDGTRIVSVAEGRTAYVFDARTGRQIAVLLGNTDELLSAVYSPDGTRIVTSSKDGKARLWDARTGAFVREFAHEEGGEMWSAAFSPDGATIVTASTDYAARVWDSLTGVQLTVLSGHKDILASALYSPDGTHILTTAFDGTARLWDTHVGPKAVVLLGHTDAVSDVAYSPDGRRVVTAAADKTVRIWDVKTGTQLAMVGGLNGEASSAEYSRDGNHIVSTQGEDARIWDAHTLVLLASLSNESHDFQSASYSSDGSRIVTSQGDGTARIWDVRTRAELLVLKGHTDYINTVVFSPDDSRVMTASVDKSVRIWDSRSGGLLAILPHPDFVNSADYSRDGSRIVTACKDSLVRVWDARTNALILVLSGHRGFALSAAFSPDGRRVVSSGFDNTVRFWDARTGTQLAVLLGHTAIVAPVTYSPDGTQVASASSDKTVRIWDARVPAELPTQIAWAQSAVSDPISVAERTKLGFSLRAGSDHAYPNSSECDRQGAAYYDPDRRGSGIEQSQINADIAMSACNGAGPASSDPRRLFQAGRALVAKGQFKEASAAFELAISQGYRAARIDLANLLIDNAAGILNPARAAALYEKAWNDGVPIAAFKLGQLYELGAHRVEGSGSPLFAADQAKAWAWYQKGADIGEPTALGRFARRDDDRALGETSPQRANDDLLQAFKLYATAAERAENSNWPDTAWRHWRYRRSTLAHFLAREGMMQQVADTYRQVKDQRTPHP